MAATLNTTADKTYWQSTYRGHEIAALRHSRGWLVYLDRIMQENTLLATADDAAKWLRRHIDGYCRAGL